MGLLRKLVSWPGGVFRTSLIGEGGGGGGEGEGGGREGPYTRLKVELDVFWAIRMGSPQRSSHYKSNTKNIYLNTYLGSDSGLKIVDGSSVARCWNDAGLLHTSY
jgi:hypothetical protein